MDLTGVNPIRTTSLALAPRLCDVSQEACQLFIQDNAKLIKLEVQKCRTLQRARWGPLTTISRFIPSYTHLQPWSNRVCWGSNYLITRGAPSRGPGADRFWDDIYS